MSFGVIPVVRTIPILVIGTMSWDSELVRYSTRYWLSYYLLRFPTNLPGTRRGWLEVTSEKPISGSSSSFAKRSSQECDICSYFSVSAMRVDRFVGERVLDEIFSCCLPFSVVGEIFSTVWLFFHWRVHFRSVCFCSVGEKWRWVKWRSNYIIDLIIGTVCKLYVEYFRRER